MINEKLRTAVFRFIFTVFLASGFLLPVYAVLGCLSLAGKGILISVCISLILSVSGLSKPSAIAAGVLIPLALIVWICISGFGHLTEVARAFTIQLNGVSYALPLVFDDVVVFLSLIISFLSFPMVLKKTGSWLSLLLCSAIVLILWLNDVPQFTVYLLPALIASFTILLLERHEEISLFRVLPFVVLIVFASFFLTPSSGIVIPDAKKFADELRQSIMDRMFYTEPRDVFSLLSEGYYPQGSSQLGGPAEPSDRLIMQVSAPKDVYLRGVILDQYNGRCWKNTVGGRRYLWDSRNSRKKRISIFNQDLPSSSLCGQLNAYYTVSVRMLSGSASTLFVPQRIHELTPGGDLVAYFSPSSEVFSTRNLQAGDTWSVISSLFTAGDPGLDTFILSVSDTDDPDWNSMLDLYTSLPDHLEQPVKDLAVSITSGLISPYDKAFAIQSWLSRNCRYTLDVPEQPADMDFVTHFLFNTKEGYCTYFASAMTVLCRLAGLPARYVEGYLAEPDSTGEALVTAQQGHAWTEVYFKGFGWLTFDATPRRISQSVPGETPSPLPSPASTPTPDPKLSDTEHTSENPEPTPSSSEADLTPDAFEAPDSDENTLEPPEAPKPAEAPSENIRSLWWLFILFTVIVALIVRIIITNPDYREKRAKTDRERFNIRISDMNLLLFAAGKSRRPGETPMSFTRRLDAEDCFNVSLSAFGECVSLCSYGNVEPIESDIALIRDTYVLLRSDLPVPTRIRYLYTRIFTSRRSMKLI